MRQNAWRSKSWSMSRFCAANDAWHSMPNDRKLARSSPPWVALAATERHLADLIEKRAERVPGGGPIASLATASKDAA